MEACHLIPPVFWSCFYTTGRDYARGTCGGCHKVAVILGAYRVWGPL
jgi:hypothetical protein